MAWKRSSYNSPTVRVRARLAWTCANLLSNYKLIPEKYRACATAMTECVRRILNMKRKRERTEMLLIFKFYTQTYMRFREILVLFNTLLPASRSLTVDKHWYTYEGFIANALLYSIIYSCGLWSKFDYNY